MRSTILVALVAALLPASLFAQSNEVTLFANRASLKTVSETNTEGEVARVNFSSRTGYGVSFNHFFSPSFSVEVAGQTLHARSRLSITDGPITFHQDAGSIDLKQYDVALHWILVSGGGVRPWIGAGVGRIQSGKLNIPAALSDTGNGPETVRLENKTSWIADAGIDVRMTPHAGLSLSAKYMPYKTTFGAGPGDTIDRITLDPITYSVGVRWTF
jgi:outer membrane protein W